MSTSTANHLLAGASVAPRTRRALSRTLLACALFAAAPAVAQTVSHDLWIPDGEVRASLVVDHMLFIGGRFGVVGPPTGNAVPLGASTGRPLSAFARFSGGPVYAIAPDGAGGWYVGGGFSAVNGAPCGRVVHQLADGSVANWNPAPDGDVRSILVIGNTVYLGGEFVFVHSQWHRGIAAVDATTGLPLAWDPDVGGFVRCMASSAGVLYVGGAFTSIGGLPRRGLGAIDAATGAVTAWNPNADSDVLAMALDGANLVVGGLFTSIGGQFRERVARLDLGTALATAWDPGANADVCALRVVGSRVYLGGRFDQVGGRNRARLACVDAAGHVTAWNPEPTNGLYDNVVAALASDGSTLFAGGQFREVVGQPRGNLAAFDLVTGDLTPWSPLTGGRVEALDLAGGTLYVGGEMGTVGGVRRTALAAIDLDTGRAADWDAGLSGYNPVVTGLAAENGVLYAGGDFESVGGEQRMNLAAVDLATGALRPWNPMQSWSSVTTLAAQSGVVYVGCVYNAWIGGATRDYLAAVDAVTGEAAPWAPVLDAQVTTIQPAGGVVYTGGHFGTVGGIAHPYVAAIDASTGQPTAWDPAADGYVYAIALRGGDVLLGGGFAHLGAATRSCIGAVNAVTGLPTSWNPEAFGEVYALMPLGADVLVGGGFEWIGGGSHPGVARIDATTGAGRPGTPVVRNAVNTLAHLGSRVLMGGGFTTVNDWPNAFLAGFTVSTVGAPAPVAAGDIRLAPPAPNPFREATVLRFTLPARACVTLRVHDVAGRCVRTLIDREWRNAGEQRVSLTAAGLPSGRYLCALEVDGRAAVRPVTVLR